MMKRKYMSYYHSFNKPGRRRRMSACPQPNISASITPSGRDHKTLCLSLIENLVNRGLTSSAHGVIQRMIAQCGTVNDIAILAGDVEALCGFDFDLGTYSFIVKKLVNLGEFALAEVIYCQNFVNLGVIPDLGLLNSMVICYCNLGKLEEAKSHFDRLLFEKRLEPYACNAILRAAGAGDRILEAYDYLLAIHNAGIDLTYRCYHSWVVNLCVKGYLSQAIHVFLTMRIRFIPCVHLYKTLVYELCKRGSADKAESMCYDMEAEGFFMDKKMYTSLINGYCKRREMKMAMRIFFRMIKTGCDPDSYTYNTLIHGFGLQGLDKEGWILYEQMVDLGVKRSMATYHVLITRYRKEHNVNYALALLNSLLGQNLVLPVHSYTAVIDLLYKDKDDRSADIDELYMKMLDNGVVPDHVLFFTIMKHYPKGRELELALKILQDIAKNWCVIDPLLSLGFKEDLKQNIELLVDEIAKFDLKLGSVAFSIFITSLCALGKIDDALICKTKMETLRCRPFLSTYNSLIKCLIREGCIDDDATSVFEVIRNEGSVPNVATYLIVINELCKRDDLVSAFDILDQMDERQIRPSVAIFDSIICCLSRRQRMFGAKKVFQRMRDVGVYPDEVIYVNMINGYSKSGMAPKAIHMFEEMEGNGFKPSAHAFTAIIYGLVKKNMAREGRLYLERMWEDDIVPNTALYTSLINQFLKNGEFQIALSLVKMMEKNNVKSDLVTNITLFRDLCRCITFGFLQGRHSDPYRNPERVDMLYHLLPPNSLMAKKDMFRFSLGLVNKVKESSLMQNLYIYTSMISGYCRAGRLEDAYDFLESNDLQPNHVTFTILMNGHFKIGDIDNALEIFNMMADYGSPPDKIAYNALVRGLGKSGRPLDSLLVSQVIMRKRGHTPGKASYEFLLNMLCRSSFVSHSFDIFQEMISHRFVPCRYNYNLLLRILCEEDKLSEACLVIDMMPERRKLPDEDTRKLMLALAKKKKGSSP